MTTDHLASMAGDLSYLDGFDAGSLVHGGSRTRLRGGVLTSNDTTVTLTEVFSSRLTYRDLQRDGVAAASRAFRILASECGDTVPVAGDTITVDSVTLQVIAVEHTFQGAQFRLICKS